MKNSTPQEVTAQGANYSTDKKDNVSSKNNCHISYMVKLEIFRKDENGRASLIVNTEKTFKEAKALDARRKAFAYAYQLQQDALIEGKLCEYHIDTQEELVAKKERNISIMYIKVYCIDDQGIGKTLVSDGVGKVSTFDAITEMAEEYNMYERYEYSLGKVEPVTLTMGDDEMIFFDYQGIQISPRLSKKTKPYADSEDFPLDIRWMPVIEK